LGQSIILLRSNRMARERYCELVRKNIVSLIGAVPLTKLKPAHISAAYAKVLISVTAGREGGQGGHDAENNRCPVNGTKKVSTAIPLAVKGDWHPRTESKGTSSGTSCDERRATS
jgi:hypothetical protein